MSEEQKADGAGGLGDQSGGIVPCDGFSGEQDSWMAPPRASIKAPDTSIQCSFIEKIEED